MPTYDYVCTSCENHWEEVQKISEAPLDTCPKCSQKTAKRQISGGNFILKGGGWYADLYASPSNKKKDNGSSESKSSSESSASTSSSTSTDSGSKANTSPPPATTTTTKKD